MTDTPEALFASAFEQVAWEVSPGPHPKSGLYATHHGVLDIMGKTLRCYRLNNGQAVFHADDVHAFFDWTDHE